MPRAYSRAVALAVLALSAAPAAAQPGDPLDLARGLRDNGLADLALEYLDRVAAGKPSPALKALLPLERALARLDLAADETDDARRDALIARAKTEFEQFLSTQPNHPRRAEAAVALARVVSAQAKSTLSRSNKIADDIKRGAARAKARPIFEDAAKRFGQAAAAYAKRRDDPDLTDTQKKEVARDVFQAELDRAVNSYLLADTYGTTDAKETVARGNALKQARGLFVQLGKRDAAGPLAWVAKAWAAECLREMDSGVAARKEFDAVHDAAKKSAVAAAGARLARFFEARTEFLAARNAAGFRKAQLALEHWLAEPANRTARPPPQVFAARWYVAIARDQQARALIDPKTKPPTVPPSARALLKQAEHDYQRVMRTPNDYSARAAERRTQVLRLLVGDAGKDPAAIATFDEAVMAAQVQLDKALREAETPEDRAAQMAKAAALYERARALPAPAGADREATDAAVNLVFAYRLSGRPLRAAVLGEYLARTARPAEAAARAGQYAVQSYLQAAAGVDPADAAARRADQDRAAALTAFLDKQYPTDPGTDSARALLGQLLYQQGRHREAFDLLARVRPASPTAAAARLLQGAAALELLRPTPASTEADAPPLDAKQKADLYRRAVAALTAVPAALPDAAADDARLAVLLKIQLAELHLTDAPAGSARAEQTAAAAIKAAAAFKELTAEDRKELTLRAEHARLRAVYAQALPLYQAGKYAEAAAKVAPILAAAAKDGPAAKEGQPEAVAAAAKRVDQFRRDDLLVLAMQARIKEGAGEKVGELFDLMKKLGGSLDAGVSTVAALVAAVRPQAEALRRAGKPEEADRLLRGVGVVLDKVAAEPNLTPRVRVFLGGGLTDTGQPDKAVEVLAKVPAPSAEDLAKKPADLDDTKRPPVLLYRQARLETVRALRTAGRFTDADQALAEAMGTKEKPGWAADDQAFRRELAYVLEARAAATPDGKQAAALWGEANQKWTALANEYLPTLRRLVAGKQNATAAVRALADLNALPPHKLLPRSPEEVKKGLTDPKPPAWVTELLTETTPGPDGKLRPNPTAQAYTQALRQAAARMEAQIKPRYHDLFFESMRCLTRANAHVLKDRPAELTEKLRAIADTVRQLESLNPDLAPEVRDKFAALMAEYPALKAEYDRAKPEAVAAAPDQDTPPAGGNGSESPEPVKPAAAPVAGNGGTTGLVVGGVVGLLALAGVAAYFALFRKPAPPPRRSAPAPLFDDLEG
ncbi:MAG TPA: hypothetical protein VFG68_18275 [Fimbriiglobus sp.]|nr:hypothetical protein [Fimbriiglobus sp.]